MKTCLVTGGAGFIGSHLCKALLKRGYIVRVLDNLSTGDKNNLFDLPVDFIEGDLRDSSAVSNAAKGAHVIFHEAAMGSVEFSIREPKITDEINVQGSKNVLEAAVLHKVQKVISASSCAVYGNEGTLPKSENQNVFPASPYAESKLQLEKLCERYCREKNLQTASLRYFNVYGENQSFESDYAAVIPKFFHAVVQKEPAVLFGDGNQTRDFVYVQDVVSANLALLDAEKLVGDVFNVASGVQTSIKEVLQKIQSLFDCKQDPICKPAREGEVRFSVGDPSKLESKVDYRPNTSLQEGLQKCAWYYQNSIQK